MSTPDFSSLVGRHRNCFRSGATRPSEWREGQLTALRAMMTEHVLGHVQEWMKPVPLSAPDWLTPSNALVRFDPLGVGLIIGTWNYPLMLSLSSARSSPFSKWQTFSR